MESTASESLTKRSKDDLNSERISAPFNSRHPQKRSIFLPKKPDTILYILNPSGTAMAISKFLFNGISFLPVHSVIFGIWGDREKKKGRGRGRENRSDTECSKTLLVIAIFFAVFDFQFKTFRQ
ncbi:hypothetical protein CDAR_259891 [Caerostris darwini]|uniref:Uncharacterized protein n=1 Tax=Caerostris darwini TaxID=1538125 RepID=A0AAV4Q5X6_9ARAC|nr:hypothetical protein CDAR_259891 [Caerostris darwini]